MSEHSLLTALIQHVFLMLFCSLNSIQVSLNKTFPTELDPVCKWVKMNELVLYNNKIKCMVFGSRNAPANTTVLNLSLDGTSGSPNIRSFTVLVWPDRSNCFYDGKGQVFCMCSTFSHECSCSVIPGILPNHLVKRCEETLKKDWSNCIEQMSQISYSLFFSCQCV